MIVEMTSRPEPDAPWTFSLEMVGSWLPIGWVAGNAQPGVVAAAESVGIDPSIALPIGGELLLAASLLEFSTPPEASPPLMASVIVIEAPRLQTVRLACDGVLSPCTEQDNLAVEWPAGVGTVECRQISYTVATPDPERALTVVFSTPNLTMLDEMTVLFDTIISSGRFRVPASAAGP